MAKFNRTPNGKTLLFIGGPSDAVPAIAGAWAFGYDVIVIDGDVDAPGMKWADMMWVEKGRAARWGMASTYDTDDTLLAARTFERYDNTQFNGVLAVATDVGPVVSQVAQALNLPHIPYEISRLSWDKQALKDKLSRGGISTPAPADYVIKPNYQGRGARGVSVIPASSLPSTYGYQQAVDNSADKTALYEQFVFGPQVSAEAIIWDGEVVFCGYTDRDYSNGYPVEVGGWGPSKFAYIESLLGYKVGLEAIIDKVVKELNIETGTIKLDIVLDKYRDYIPVIIEMAIGRLSGGLMCSHYIPLAYGVNFLEMAFQVACGEKPVLRQIAKPRRVRGFYSNKNAAIHKERGRFKLCIEPR